MGFLQQIFNGGDRAQCSSGECGDASSALFQDCYDGPPSRNECSNGGCGDFCYSCTDCNKSYYENRGVGIAQGCGGSQAPMMLSGFMNPYGGSCGGGGGGRSGFARGMGGFGGGMLGGIIGRFIGRLFGGGGGGGGCDDGGCDGGGGDDFEDDSAERYDEEREQQVNSRRRLDREREELEANGTRRDRSNPTRAEQVVDNVRGVSDRDKEDAKEMSSYEQESLRLINNFRQRNGLDPVTFDPRLQLSALVHSKYQNENGLGHSENERGWETPSKRMAQVGVKSWIENAAYGHMPTPESLVNMWINSPGHRAALLNKNAQIAGVSKQGRGATLNMA